MSSNAMNYRQLYSYLESLGYRLRLLRSTSCLECLTESSLLFCRRSAKPKRFEHLISQRLKGSWCWTGLSVSVTSPAK